MAIIDRRNGCSEEADASSGIPLSLEKICAAVQFCRMGTDANPPSNGGASSMGVRMVEIPPDGQVDLENQQRLAEFNAAKDANHRNHLVFRLVFVGFIISGLIALMIIGGVIWISIQNIGRATDNQVSIPEVLQNWGGVIVGFYFGAFITLIKDFIKLS